MVRVFGGDVVPIPNLPESSNVYLSVPLFLNNNPPFAPNPDRFLL